MKTIFKSVFGSRLYGCSLPSSDTDYKGVFLFNLDELLSQAADNVQSKDPEVNIETEMFHARRFINLLASGQTVAYSMLFTPDNMILETSQAWETLRRNKDKIVSKSLKPFVGYARSQAQKYSLKGDKLKTLEDVLVLVNYYIQQYGAAYIPSDRWYLIEKTFKDRPGIRFWTDVKGGVETRLMEVCGLSMGETTAMKLWLPPLQKLHSQYGTRAQEAKETNGMDLKALYHAVRICSEMNEVLTTGNITYPRPERELLLDIRSGKLTNGEISNIIDTLIAKGEELMKISTLRETADREFLDNWYKSFQIDEIASSFKIH